jgi:hypothetical protein
LVGFIVHATSTVLLQSNTCRSRMFRVAQRWLDAAVVEIVDGTTQQARFLQVKSLMQRVMSSTRFATMITTSIIVMYLNTCAVDHVFYSQNRSLDGATWAQRWP